MENLTSLSYEFWQYDATIMCFSRMVAAGSVVVGHDSIFWLAKHILIMGWSEDPHCEETFEKLIGMLTKEEKAKITS